MYPLVGRATTSSTHSDHILESDKVFTLLVERPMALTGHNESLEVTLHRRIERLTDRRGNDNTVVNDLVLIGFLGEGRWS